MGVNSMSLLEKTVVIVGGSSGIGLAAAQLAHGQGAKVFQTVAEKLPVQKSIRKND
jgi:NAD(P)-dependent dehydrogenase (short-subunit alcohol dehydrogenase family)